MPTVWSALDTAITSRLYERTSWNMQINNRLLWCDAVSFGRLMLFLFFCSIFYHYKLGDERQESLGIAAANRPNIPALNDGLVYVYGALMKLSLIRRSRSRRNQREPCLSGTRSTKNLDCPGIKPREIDSDKSKTNSLNYGTASVV
jgi:hypothetical protein